MIRMRGLRWWMIGLIMLGSIINYLTRSTLAVAAPTILKDLQITTQQYSWIVGAFQATIMLQPICGYVLDVLGLKRGYAIFVAAWSAISMSHGMAHSWQAFAAPKGLPDDIRTKLHGAIVSALNDPSVKDKLVAIGFEIVANSPQEFTAFQASEFARWKKVIEVGKITAD